jgi:integrase/recombinase XerD
LVHWRETGSNLSVDVDHVYENPEQRQPRDTILYPGANRKDNKTREVPTHWALKLMLAAYQPPESGFLFPSFYNNEQHLSRQAMDKVFRLAVQKQACNIGDFPYIPRDEALLLTLMRKVIV